MDKILNYFLEEPEREFHVRELAKLTRRSPTTVSKILKQLSDKKILLSQKKLNHLLFKADNENQKFKDLKLADNIRKIRQSGLIDYLADEYNHPETIVLFGSFAKAENSVNSDIDILIVAASKKEINLSAFEKKLNHKIQLFIRSAKDINKMKDNNKELLNSWINGIVLSGFWELFK